MNNILVTNVSATQESNGFLVYQSNNRVHYLPQKLLERIEFAVHDLAITTIRGKALTLKQYFGSKLWKKIADGQPVLAGLCMAYLVANQRVSFKPMGIDPSSKAQRYALN